MNPSDIIKLGSDPISQERPAGESARYEPEYEKLQMEVRKLESLNGEAVAWEEWMDLGVNLLEKKSKDMLLAAYLCLAAFHRMGYEGLASSLILFRDLVSNYWDGLFPELKRMRGRASAVSWLSERVGEAVSQKKPAQSDTESLSACQVCLDELEGILRERMAEAFPGLVDLKTAVREKLKEVEQKEEDLRRVAERSERAKASTGPTIRTGMTADETVSEKDAEKAMREVRSLVRRASDVFRAADPRNPVPYRALRSILWMDLTGLPPNTDQKTQIPGVPPAEMQRFQGWLDAGDWTALLENAEAGFGERVLWLDVHFFSDKALAGLGADHQGARDVVQQELAGLLQRLPGLDDLLFSDGVPLAGPQTRMWIQKEVLPKWVGGGPDSGGMDFAVSAPMEGPLKEILEKTSEARSAGRFEEAIAVFQRGMHGLPSGRDRFRCRLEMAKMCMESGKATLAMPLLEALEEECVRFSLEAWEPGLCVELLRALIGCCELLFTNKKQRTPEALEREERLHARLCRIDMTAALRFKRKH